MLANLFIVWSEFYETKIPILDEQHRGLVATINSLFYFMNECGIGEMKKDQACNVFKPTLAALEYYRDIHFLTEEFLMETTGYPRVKDHKLLHEKFRADTTRLIAKSRKTLDPHELLVLFKNWWTDHVRIADQAYESHLQAALQMPGKL